MVFAKGRVKYLKLPLVPITRSFFSIPDFLLILTI